MFLTLFNQKATSSNRAVLDLGRQNVYPTSSLIRLMSAVLCCISVSACSVKTDASKTSQKPQATPQTTFEIQVLGMNDFHGQVLSADEKGGMLNLASHLIYEIESSNLPSFVLHGGDHVGASPAESALLQDEPAIDFLNVVSDYCQQFHKHTCKVIGTAGNHEFDEGSEELLRLLNGGTHAKGPFIHEHWQGARYETLSANVIDRTTGQPLLKPYTVHQVNGVDIGFIGITLDSTPDIVLPGVVDNLHFLSQISAVNKYVSLLQKKGIEAIIVIVHDGSESEYYSGQTRDKQTIPLDSGFGRFIRYMPAPVDLVVSGHSHQFTNVYVETLAGENLLITQAFSSGRAFADITLTVDSDSKDIVKASAEVVLVDDASRPRFGSSDTLNNEKASQNNEKRSINKIADLISQSTEYAQNYTTQVINTYKPKEGERQLGNLLANAHNYALKADVAVMNKGGVRAELLAGDVTWGDLFAVQPFGNELTIRRYTGLQLKQLVNGRDFWSDELAIVNGHIEIQGKSIIDDKMYTVGGNSYIMNSKGFSEGERISQGGNDLEATVNFIKQLPKPFNLSSVL